MQLARLHVESGHRWDWHPGPVPSTPLRVRAEQGGGLPTSTGLDLLLGAPGTPVLGPFYSSVTTDFLSLHPEPMPSCLELPPAPGDPDKRPEVEMGATSHPHSSSCIYPVS